MDYIIRVLQAIADGPQKSIDQIGDCTHADFETLFDCEPALNSEVEKRLTRQRILWVIQRLTMIELSHDSEVFLSSMPLGSINTFLGELDYCAHDELPARRRSSGSTLVPSLSNNVQEAPKALSQDVLNIQNLVTRHSVSIQWVNNPLQHLSMPSNNALQLFWHASWCKSHSVASMTGHDLSICSVLGIPVSYFDEILLAYRLLFDGFSLASTQTYYQLTRDSGSQQMQLQCRDVFMDITCGLRHQVKDEKQGIFIDYSRFEDSKRSKNTSKRWTSADFSHFRDRLQILQSTIESSKAAGLTALWRYEKGSMSWFAFW